MREKALKVVHILEAFLGGTATYACTVLPRLVQRGLDVTLICSLNRSDPDAPARIARLKKSGVRVYIVPMSRGIGLFSDIRSFAAILCLLLEQRFDVIHTHCSKAGALGRVAAALAGGKVTIHSPHCFAFLRCRSPFGKSLYLGVERLLGRLTTKLVAVSQSEASAAIRGRIVPDHKCIAIKNGLLDGRFLRKDLPSPHDFAARQSLGIGRDSDVVTTACRLVGYKGVFRFLQAARLSHAPNATFLLAGDGDLKVRAEKFISENGLHDKVKLLGHVSNMERIYAVSDVVVLCSDAEAQPYLLLEAMRARRPIVATAVIGNTELISHKKTGLLVEPTPESIAAAIDELLADRAKRNEYAEKAYVYFRERHTLQEQVSRLTDLYKGCLLNECSRHTSAALGLE